VKRQGIITAGADVIPAHGITQCPVHISRTADEELGVRSSRESALHPTRCMMVSLKLHYSRKFWPSRRCSTENETRRPNRRRARVNTETVQVTIADAVAKVVFNRPRRRRMNPQLHADMTQVLETLRDDDSAHCARHHGAGDAFSRHGPEGVLPRVEGEAKEYNRVLRMATEWR